MDTSEQADIWETTDTVVMEQPRPDRVEEPRPAEDEPAECRILPFSIR